MFFFLWDLSSWLHLLATWTQQRCPPSSWLEQRMWCMWHNLESVRARPTRLSSWLTLFIEWHLIPCSSWFAHAACNCNVITTCSCIVSGTWTCTSTQYTCTASYFRIYTSSPIQQSILFDSFFVTIDHRFHRALCNQIRSRRFFAVS